MSNRLYILLFVGLLVLFITGCYESIKRSEAVGDKVLIGDRFVSNVTYLIYNGSTKISEYSVIWNTSLDNTCRPTQPAPSSIITDSNYSIAVVDIPNISVYTIFHDIERPTCFHGFYNTKTKLGG
jgi:hypothetical protein